MSRTEYARTQRSDLIRVSIEGMISSLYNKVIHNSNNYYDIDNISNTVEEILINYMELNDDNKIIYSKDLVNRHLILFTKILTICDIETTGYLTEMSIPQIIIGIYKNKDNIPRIPFILNVTIPKLDDIVPDSSSYVEEFIRSFIIMYKEYFYSDEVELENFKIPLYLAHTVDYLDKKIHTIIMSWFHRYLKGHNRILNNNDVYIIDMMHDFMLYNVFARYDINWTKTYCLFSETVGTEMMPYYFEASLDSFWILDQLLRAVTDGLYLELSNLVQEFYYNPLLIRLIIGTKMRMFITYARRIGRYYYESII